jgi:hypothetical protein
VKLPTVAITAAARGIITISVKAASIKCLKNFTLPKYNYKPSSTLRSFLWLWFFSHVNPDIS